MSFLLRKLQGRVPGLPAGGVRHGGPSGWRIHARDELLRAV